MQRLQINEDGQAIEVGDGSSYTVFRLDLGWAALIVAAAFLAVVGACGVVMGINISRIQSLEDAAVTQTKEARLVQYYLMDPHSRTPEELASWAKFNRDHEEK